MATTLRDFIAQREAEIREQQRALKAELKELLVAKNALDAQDAVKTVTVLPPAMTIKDMARDVLADAEKGMTSAEILAAIKAKHGREIDRTSLSPQLSRLKESGDLLLYGERWWAPAMYRKLEDELEAQRLLEDDSDSVNVEIDLGGDDEPPF